MRKSEQQTKIYHAALYCRLSKDDDGAGDSSSILTQKAMLEDYCRERGYIVHDIYVDDGYSGLNFDRPNFQRMLTDIDNGAVNLVVTKDLSRLGRDYIQTGYYTEIYFSNKRVRYIAVNDGYDSNREDNDIAPFRHILNDMYAKDLSRKVKSAKRQRMKNGYFISSQAPYGYKPDPDDRNRLIVDEKAAEVVRRIFALSLAGSSAKKIALTLTGEGVLTPGAYKYRQGDTRFARYVERDEGETRWVYVTVQLILKDRVYMGDMENHKAEVANYKTKRRVNVPKNEHIIVENTHEPLVSREDWEKVQMLVQARHKPPRHCYENLFRGLLFCSDCGNRMNMGTKVRGDKKYHHYHCSNHFQQPDKCPKSHQISYNNLYAVVLERIQSLAAVVRDDEAFHALVARKLQEDTQAATLAEDRRKAEKRLAELSGKVRKLFDGHSDGVIDGRNYEMLMAGIQAEQAALADKLAGIDAALARQGAAAAQMERLREAVCECCAEALDIRELSPFVLNKLVERIEVGAIEEVDGEKRQEVRICWRFAGVV